MENLSVTFRHCYYSFLFLHQPNLKYLNKHSSVCSSLEIKHASFESIPISVSLESSSSNWDHFHSLKELNRCDDLVSVKDTHARIMKLFDRFDLDLELISRYLEFGEFGYASAVFLLGSQVSWKEFSEEIENFGLEKNRILEEFVKLQNKGVNFDGLVLVMVLRICTVLTNRVLGLIIHGCLIKRGLIDTRVGSALISFYGSCVSSDIANKVFDEMLHRDDFAWNEIVMVNLRSGNWEKAVKFFREMRISAAKAYYGTIVKLLQVCSNNGGVVQGRQIHGYVIRFGFESNVSVCNSLIFMYSRNSEVESSRKVFDSMKDQDRNLSSWNSIISSYTAFGYVDEAIALLEQMKVKPDIVTWNSLLSGYAYKRGLAKDAILILKRMQISGLKPNASSIISLLQAIAEPGNLKLGKTIHGYVIRNQLSHDVYVETTLIDMYVKTSSLLYAKMVFNTMDEKKKNVVVYNSLISGLSYKDAEALMSKMEKERIKPDSVTYQNLVFVYASCGKTEEALEVIEKMKKNGLAPNVVSWTAILSGCSKNGNFKNVFEVFVKMQEGISPNSATISTLLKILSCLRLLANGKEVHCFCLKNDLIRDSYVATAVLDMYAKSGDLESAVEVFRGIEDKPKPVASWNCMIMGLAMFGKGKEGIAVFDSMIESGVKPDAITFTSVLSLCKNAGLVNEGWRYFDLMRDRFGLTPSIEHCSCMVELLGKSGYLDEAWDFIQTMPVKKPDAAVYGAFLSACKIHKELELAEIAWKKVKTLEPGNSGNYMTMIGLYSDLNRFEDVDKLRFSMKYHKVRVMDVWSWIRINKSVHFFYPEGKPHFDEGEIYFELYKLISEMTKLGYVPDLTCVNRNVSESEKVKLLMGHTEKLAITYGLIKKKGLAPIRVVKNTSICSDCHTVAKFISVLRNREIILHEGGCRIHRFKDGKCSCNDSW